MAYLYGKKADTMSSYMLYSATLESHELAKEITNELKEETNCPMNTDTYTLETIFDFGKHKGQQVEDVLEDDPNYIRWLLENEVREFDKEAMDKFAKKGLC